MSQLDDLFRDGLGARKADVPNTGDLWARINAAKGAPLSDGEALDTTFRNGLRDRQAAVPAGMWQRIAAARGRRPLARWFAAAAALLLLLTAGGIGYQMMGDTPHPGFRTETVAADHEVAVAPDTTDDSAATDNMVVDGEPTVTTKAPPFTGTSVTYPSSNDRQSATPVAPPVNEIISPVSAANPLPETSTSLSAAVDGTERLRNLATLPLDKKAITSLPLEEVLPETTFVPGKFKSTSALRGVQTELLFGVSYAQQEFSFDDPATSALREVRQVSEFPKAGYQITLRSTYRFTNRLRILGGLTYAEIRNELDYNTIVNGQSVRLSTNNHIRMLEAPLLVGYTVPGRRLNVTINAGPVVNLTTAVRGRFLDPDSPQPLDLNTDGNFRSNIGVGFTASLTTAYQIGKKRPFTLLIEPFFKAYPTSFTVRDAPLKENYWVAGLQFGVQKSL